MRAAVNGTDVTSGAIMVTVEIGPSTKLKMTAAGELKLVYGQSLGGTLYRNGVA